jgi:hypothetical protein
MTSTERDVIHTPVPEKLRFNVSAPFDAPLESDTSEATYTLPPRDPVITLTLESTHERHARQRALIDAARDQHPNISLKKDIFGRSLKWAYKCYKVNIHEDEGSRQAPIIQSHVYLFNVLVAIEWTPSPDYLAQLQDAFQRASDFLFDITDGYMGFGQIVFGGPELMHCADIQIMASNRLLPRSWVSGLVIERKYLPIRIGRGVWHKNNRTSIPWNEPEAYRTLVHEWAHYALELRDQYLATHQVTLQHVRDASAPDIKTLVQGDYTLVLPQISLATQTIMGTLEGTSELVPHYGGSEEERKREEFIVINRRYPKVDVDHAVLDGPSHVPMALPRSQAIGSLKGLQWDNSEDEQKPLTSEDAWLRVFPAGIVFSHCWVYLVRKKDHSRRVIAQGSFDSRVVFDGFRLLGAKKGDKIVIIGSDPSSQIVVTSKIQDINRTELDAVVVIDGWKFHTPKTLPRIDVISNILEESNPIAHIEIQLTTNIHNSLPQSVWICEQGQDAPTSHQCDGHSEDGYTWLSHPHAIGTLDGNVLLEWDNGDLLITSFSQGGGPATSIPSGPPPISAGSSEGNVMLFFENKHYSIDYSNVKVVTTLNHADESLDTLPDGSQARSYIFSLASNTALPVSLNPTLIMNFDASASAGQGVLQIYREHQLGEGQSEWQPIPTYLHPGSSFAAAPLNSSTAPQLTAANPQAQRVERYRLYLAPNN